MKVQLQGTHSHRTKMCILEKKKLTQNRRH